MNAVELIAKVRSGVAQVLLVRGGQLFPSGSAFLVTGGLVTNSHVIRSQKFDAIAIRFADTDPQALKDYVYLRPENLDGAIAEESSVSDRDYVYLRHAEERFDGRHIFEFTDSTALSVGEQVVFLGYPFGMTHLTSHIGHVSSIHTRNGVEVIHIDGSVNGGNCGGPLLDPKSGRVAGIVTSACVVFVAEQFDRLIESLRRTKAALESARNRPGGQLRVSAFRPDGSLFSTTESNQVRLIEHIPAGEPEGVWRYRISQLGV
jgi:hypothetical protein